MRQNKHFLLLVAVLYMSNLFELSASSDHVFEKRTSEFTTFLETDAYRISDAYQRAKSDKDFYGVSSREKGAPLSYGATLDSAPFFYCGFNNEISLEIQEIISRQARNSMKGGSECFLFIKRNGVRSFCEFARALNEAHSRNQIKLIVIDSPSKVEERKKLEASIKTLMQNNKEELKFNVVSLYFYPILSFYSKIPRKIDCGIVVGISSQETVSIFSNDLSKDGLYNLLLKLGRSWQQREEAIKNGFYKDQDAFLEHIGEINFFTPQRETIMNSIKDAISGTKPIPQRLKVISLCIITAAILYLNKEHLILIYQNYFRQMFDTTNHTRASTTPALT